MTALSEARPMAFCSSWDHPNRMAWNGWACGLCSQNRIWFTAVRVAYALSTSHGSR